MKYMLMICDDESVILSPADMHALPQVQAWAAEADGRGIRRGGARLRPSNDANTVRARNGEVLVSHGPFAETKEQFCRLRPCRGAGKPAGAAVACCMGIPVSGSAWIS